MDAKEGKRADQQAGHTPESVIEVGILIPVMMGGMRKIAGKFPVGARVALLAGFNDMAPV